MELPKKFKLGKTEYHVEAYDSRGTDKGSVRPGTGHMRVSVTHTGTPRTDAAIAETFWHELTHAILHDMGDPRWAHEAFVKGFSKRLTQAIQTAEFK